MADVSPIEPLLRVIVAEASEPATRWLQAIVGTSTFQDAAFHEAYAGAGRRFASLAGQARACLLVHACIHLPAERHAAFVREVFRKGDNHERVALLRSLCLLPQPERFLETAIEACRTHVQDVFEAIACDNPYPAAHFPDLNFQQLVMKALFTHASLLRVQGWRDRVTSELQRMARDFAAERSAAGREVPTDVALILQGTNP
jgi:hypothetical protein